MSAAAGSPLTPEQRLEVSAKDFIAFEWRHAGIHATPELIGHVNEDRYAHRDDLLHQVKVVSDALAGSRLECERARALLADLLKVCARDDHDYTAEEDAAMVFLARAVEEVQSQ